MKFSKEGNLEEIYVYSQLVLGVVSFDDNDIKKSCETNSGVFTSRT